MAFEVSINEPGGITLGDLRQLLARQDVAELPDTLLLRGRVKMKGTLTKIEIKDDRTKSSRPATP